MHPEKNNRIQKVELTCDEVSYHVVPYNKYTNSIFQTWQFLSIFGVGARDLQTMHHILVCLDHTKEMVKSKRFKHPRRFFLIVFERGVQVGLLP